ncbi:phenylalanyl-tRNA synthetase, beta subunit [Hydrogenobaculum sp. Y04AAS1]|uniref:phenylalanine--tRNA ligase subunit beta n=1 Tax=Hydrogenobaculum sp. (strain Y04AAS1) TaxID=380749 RepID=UPI00015BCCCC|nr:phenylalanyl-tRNA synthetase, beta subunit [Hydrogenobaculum sp. Y04AAS1]HCT66125.1 phenylalanine--tRNA ligase subunit beta [Hydrogenobaculum sp.]
MFAPLSILSEYVEIEDAQYVADKLSISGTETTLKRFGTDIKNVKVGEILSIQKPENFNLCKVFLGDTTIDVITSASNVYVGAKVPVAVKGATIDGKTIDTKTFKGFESQGMLLSASELGLDDIEEGILILGNNVEVGKDVASLLDFGEYVLECEITPNRGDLLSIVGISREISAITNKPFNFNIEQGLPEKIDIDISIETQGCYRYIGSIVEGLSVKSSKLWLKKALWKMGLKTISNVVDITNYVMMMLGQPLHAFDKDKIGDKIIIRQAKQKEKLTALDKKEYELDESIMVIANDKGPIALAGVIGGLDSSISYDTKNILLESALFDPIFVRKASKTLKLSTDASYRFERGVDIDMALKASVFALKLIEKEAGGKVVGYNEVIRETLPVKKFFLPMNDYVRYTALNFEKEKISEIINKLGIPNKPMRCGIEFEAPSHRYYDIDSSIDLIEEIVRITDFNSFEIEPLTLLPKPSDKKEYIYEIKNKLVATGLKEVINLSFDKIEDYEALGLEKPTIEIKNPILPSFRFLRRYLTPSMIRLADQNVKKHIYDFATFEISNIFKEDSQPTSICILLRGHKRIYPKTKWNINHIKEIVKTINKDIMFGFSSLPFLHPYQQGSLTFDNKDIGFFGVLKSDILQDTIICEFEIPNKAKYHDIKEISKYPPIVRDISLIMSIDFDVQKLIILIREFFGSMLENVLVFDFYKGEQIEENKKSVGLRLSLRALDRSLEDEEVNVLIEKLLGHLKEEGIELRFV